MPAPISPSPGNPISSGQIADPTHLTKVLDVELRDEEISDEMKPDTDLGTVGSGS